eukprot:SM000214S06776  [mRNA]  locus=s214:89554:90867:+ [translate_table: standard]
MSSRLLVHHLPHPRLPLRLALASSLLRRRYCQRHSIPYCVVGKGSNCLFDDRGYDGCIILNRIDFLEHDGHGLYRAGGGHPFNQLGVTASRNGFTGLEFACGIPGTVGGAVFMNAGANGQESSDVLKSVEVVTPEGDQRVLHREEGELPYSYRSSPFQHEHKQVAIVAATFGLSPCSEARARQHEYMTRRRQTQPISERTAGCVFRNPQVGGLSAGAMIDTLGLKGYSVGGAKVSQLHANFLVNQGNSRAMDMKGLIEAIKAQVQAAYGIELQEEVRHIPYR